MNSPANTVLILGARGRFGSATANAFQAAGWRVLAQARGSDFDVPLSDPQALAERSKGASVVVYAINPLYTEWAQHMLPLARQGMDVAERLGATFLLPGNVYAFGDRMPARLTEATPEHPSTEKGELRMALEAELRGRAHAGRLRSIVLRAGDFFGAGTGSWLDLVMLKRLSSGRVEYPGPLECMHAWAYLPDLARASVALAHQVVMLDRDLTAPPQLPAHARFHFEGHNLTGHQLLDALDQAAASLGLASPLRRSQMPWWPLMLASPFVPMLREVHRMRYLWQVPHALDGAALSRQIGDVPRTPIVEALRASLLQLGHGQPAPALPSLQAASA